MNSTRRAAGLAGAMFLFLIVTGMSTIFLWRDVRTSAGTSDALTSISENSGSIRLGTVLSMVSGISTMVLAVALYATVKHQDRNLAILALSCRAVESAFYGLGILNVLALLAVSDGYPGAGPGDVASANAIGNLLLDLRPMMTNVSATYFAVGSTLYAYLFLRARSIPVSLSMLGLVGSVLLAVGIPIQTAVGHSSFDGVPALLWAPVAVFEIAAGFWLLLKGVAVPEKARLGQGAGRVA